MQKTTQDQRQRPSVALARRRAASSRHSKSRGAGRAADPIDRYVGSRVRFARKEMSLTQEALAAELGITFQQLQKYEKGINRITAGRLHHTAKVLGVPVSFFFPAAEASSTGKAAAIRPSAETIDFLSTVDGLELSRAFSGIADASVRKRVVDLVRSIAESSSESRK